MEKRKAVSFLIVILIGIAVGTFYFVNFYFEKPEKAITKAMDSVIARNAGTAEKYLDYERLYGGQKEDKIYQAVMRDFSYEVKSVTQNGTKASAELRVGNRDMEALYGQFVMDGYQLVISDAYQPEEQRMGEDKLKQTLDEMLLSILESGETDQRLTDIQVDLKRSGRSWYVQLDHEDIDAIYGGYLSAQEAADNMLGDRSTEALANLEKAYQRNIDDTKHVLRNAVHYMADNVWNDLLCNIVSCINAGTDVNGETYDIGGGMEQLETLLEERAQYDRYISELDDVNYSEIKNEWQKLTDACDTLVQEMKDKQPEPLDFDYIPDTTEFESALKKFVQMVYPEQ